MDFNKVLENLSSDLNFKDVKTEQEAVQQVIKNSDILIKLSDWLKNLPEKGLLTDAGEDDSSVNELLVRKIKKSKDLWDKYQRCCRFLAYCSKCPPPEHILFATVFKERGNVLVKTENYKEAYDDFRFAKRYGLKDLKLEYLLAFCALKLEDINSLKTHVEELEASYNMTSKDSYTKVMLAIEPQYLQLQKRLKELVAENKDDLTVETKLPESSEKYVVHNKKVAIKHNSDCGRYVVADEIISKSDEILTEKPFAFTPIQFEDCDVTLSFKCYLCGKSNIIPYPCDGCYCAWYCSSQCLQLDQSHHEILCLGFKVKLWSQIGIGFLAFETFLIGFDSGLKISLENSTNNSESVETLLSRISKDAGVDEQYKLLLSLNSHFKSLKKDDKMYYALTAVTLACYFLYMTKLELNIESAEEIFATIMLKHITQMICNAHTVSAFECCYNEVPLPSFNNFDPLELNKSVIVINQIGNFSAIYPTVSLLNHSCRPNIVNRYDGVKLTILSTSHLQPSQEILNNYNLLGPTVSRAERKRSLKEQYHFDCNCKECKKSEDTHEELQRLRCPRCQNLLISHFNYDTMICYTSFELCSRCRMQITIQEIVDKINMIENTDVKDLTRNLEETLKAIKFCTARLHPYHNFTLNIYGWLLKKLDQRSRSELFSDYLAGLEYIYGNLSSEYILKRFSVTSTVNDCDWIFQEYSKVLPTQLLDMLKVLKNKH